MDVHIKALNEGGHRVLRELNRKRPACMKEAGKKQNATRQKKIELFYVILFIALMFIAVLRVAGPIVITIWNVFFKS